MTETLTPVDEYVTIELYQYEDKSLGFKLIPMLDEPPSLMNLAEMTHYLAASMLENTYQSPTIFNSYIMQSGRGQVYWERQCDFRRWRNYSWLKRTTQQSVWWGPCDISFEVTTACMKPLWFLEWCLMRAVAYFKPSQNGGPAAGAGVPGHAAEHSLELSKASQTASDGVVIPFPSKGKR